MIIFEGKLFGLAENVRFKKASDRGRRLKYFLYADKKAYPIKGISAKLFEGIIHTKTLRLSEISKFGRAVKRRFLYFLESEWVKEKAGEKARRYSLSSYTYCASKDGKYYLINFLYKSIDRISKETYECIVKKEYTRLPFHELFHLYARRYIQDDWNTNEACGFESQIDNKIVYLIFSYSCNLRCTYCFERNKDRNTRMSEETLKGAIEFIDSLSLGNTVVINFYGGEPLLEENRDYLTRVFNHFKDNENVYFRFITNGIFIDRYIDTLMEFKSKIVNFVITLDGAKTINDSRRISEDMQGSFDSIINSIGILNKNDFNVAVRINIDNGNIGCQEELIRYLNKTVRKRRKVTIDYHRVEDKCNIDYNPVSHLDCYKLYKRVKKISKFNVAFNLPVINVLNAIEKNSNTVPQIKKSFCLLDSNYAIDYDGRIYSCNEAMGNVDFQIGTVGQKTARDCSMDLHMGNCKSCIFYPACYGGCYLDNYYNRKQTGRNSCDYIRIMETVDYFLANSSEFI